MSLWNFEELTLGRDRKFFKEHLGHFRDEDKWLWCDWLKIIYTQLKKWAFYRMGLFLFMTRRKSCLIPSTPYRSSSSIKRRIASRSLFWQVRKTQSYLATCQLFNLFREIISTYKKEWPSNTHSCVLSLIKHVLRVFWIASKTPRSPKQHWKFGRYSYASHCAT